MKQNLFNKLWLRVGMIVAIMTTALAGTAWAESAGFTLTTNPITNGSSSGVVTGSTNETWNLSIVGSTYNGASNGNWQIGSRNNPATSVTASTSGISGTITKVVVKCSSYKAATVNVTVGGSAFGSSQTSATGQDPAELTFEGSASGDIVVTMTNATSGQRAMYLKSIIVTYTTGGSTTETVATPSFSVAEGTYTSAQTVAISCATSGATIYYTTDGSAPSTESSVYSSAIAVSSTTTIKAIAAKSGMTTSAVAEATYTIVNLAHAGTAEDPYTVADAITLLTAAPSTTFEDVYVSGIISQVDSYNSKYNSITYWISDDGTTTDQFEVYSGKGLNGADFSSEDDLIVGSEVTVKGNIKKYNSIFEFDVNSQIVSLVEPTYPIINVENATLNLTYDATSGEIEYTITNATSATLTATSSASWISNITVGASSVTFTTTANNGTTDREATITLSYTDAESVTVTVTQGHFVADYAELPFEFDGGQADIAETAGLSHEGIDSKDYSSSPKLKFNNTDDYLVLHFNERPGTLTFDIKGNGAGSDPWAGTFKVQTSEDGVTYTDLETYTELGSTQSESFNTLGENVRYIKWIYTEKSSGNVALGNIKLAKYGEAQTYTLSWTAGEHSEIFVFDAEDDSEPLTSGVSVAEGTTIYVSVGADEGYEISALTVKDANNSTIALSEEGENYYSFEMPASNVTITSTATQSGVTPVTGDKYVKVTSTTDLTDGQYLIVYEEGSVAFNGGLETLDAVGNTIDVTISNDEIAVTEATAAAEFTIDMTAGTIQSASGMYIGQTSDANGLVSNAETTYENVISITEENADIVSGGAYLRYNSASNQTRFRYYKSSSYTGQKAIQLYKKVEAVEPITVTLNGFGYATFASTKAIDFTDATDYTAWQITGVNEGAIIFAPITGAVAAGTGVLLKGTESQEITLTEAETGTDISSTNKLVGFTVATNVQDNQYYGLKNDKFVKVNAGQVPAGKALLPATVVHPSGNGVKSLTFVFDDDATGISTVETFTEDGAIYNLAGQRLQKMQKGINIVNGKKVLK